MAERREHSRSSNFTSVIKKSNEKIVLIFIISLLGLFMHYYFPGMIVGVILLQTSIIAPTLFKKLDIKDFSKVIRSLWPKFFIFLIIAGAATLVDLYLHDNPNVLHYGIAGLTTLFAITCYAIIPATNRATDEGNEKKFNILHKTSVYLTVITLLLNIGFLFV
tara:strand:+ start:2499 stop:2987 length:489 start_codon:yes stop_codon:yes gene_type:complete